MTIITPLVCILQCWRTTLKPMRAHIQLYVQVVIITFNVVISRCFLLLLRFVLFCKVCFFCLFVCFFLQRTARNCSKLHATRAAQFSVLARPIKFLITGVVISDLVVDAIEHTLLSYLLHHSTYLNYRYPLVNFMV